MDWISYLAALTLVAAAGVLMGLKYSQIYALAAANSIVFLAFLVMGWKAGLLAAALGAVAGSVVMQVGCLCALIIESSRRRQRA